ncbi:M1 family metallopeptidase [Marinicrinis sediminis]|uniref:M1 family metallopeptidase n=1 Tax=Marinicrinis sediminis TaxID=1652465 RepID=A0ABW5RER4_9BACL
MKTRNSWLYAFMVPAASLILTFAFLTYLFQPPSSQGGPALSVLAPDAGKSPAQSQLTPDAQVKPEKPKPVSLSKRVSEYHIEVKLDEEEKALQGQQTLSWKHPGVEPVKEVYLHMYANAFESEQTTFYRESGGKLRNEEVTDASFGGIQLTSLKENGDEIIHRVQYVQPDDGNPHDHTLLKVRLSDPLKPGEELRLKMSFHVQLPAVYARMGYADDFIMAGQWFPKIAAYETKGTRGRETEGWNLHQYHGNSEFYADFGIYNVKIDVPSQYIVAATGFPASRTQLTAKRKVYHFYADDVHDFAWAASPDFVYVEEPFSAKAIPGVKIKLYLDPAHEHLKDRYLFAAKRALSQYSNWYGTYPYSTLSIVVPPEEGKGAGGMEYPTLITAWGAESDNPGYELERVIVHEIGHQYWYGMVASNEFEEAWLDEAFTSYAEDKVMEQDFDMVPPTPVEALYMTQPAPMQQESWAYDSHRHYAENVYTRGKLILLAIEKDIGAEQMKKVLRTYFQQWKFKHPSTQSFQRILERVTDQDWNPFFEQYVYGSHMSDFRVASIQTHPHPEDTSAYESMVKIERKGGTVKRVSILFHFEDGQDVVKIWDGQEKEGLFSLTSESPLKWVAIDPLYQLPLENKRVNNFMHAEIDNASKTKWTTSASQLYETLLGLLAW